MRAGVALGAAVLGTIVASEPVELRRGAPPAMDPVWARRCQPLAEPAPAAEFRRLQGTPIRLAELRGRVVVIDYWATWCEPCVQEMPDLARFAGWAGRRNDVVFLSVNDDTDAGALAHFLDKHRPSFGIVRPDSGDPFAIESYPTKVLIDTSGTIRFRCTGGPMPARELRLRVLSLLEP